MRRRCSPAQAWSREARRGTPGHRPRPTREDPSAAGGGSATPLPTVGDRAPTRGREGDDDDGPLGTPRRRGGDRDFRAELIGALTRRVDARRARRAAGRPQLIGVVPAGTSVELPGAGCTHSVSSPSHIGLPRYSGVDYVPFEACSGFTRVATRGSNQRASPSFVPRASAIQITPTAPRAATEFNRQLLRGSPLLFRGKPAPSWHTESFGLGCKFDDEGGLGEWAHEIGHGSASEIDRVVEISGHQDVAVGVRRYALARVRPGTALSLGPEGCTC